MTTRCQRSGCGRPLTAARSVARGFSKACAAIVSAEQAATEGFTDLQVAKARKLIAAGGIKPMSRPGFYRARSSDKSTTYIVCAPTGHCGCPHGCHSRQHGHCYHVAAARILWAREVLKVSRRQHKKHIAEVA